METLAGKIALITGASRGVGQQIAVGLAGYGCDIIVHARKAENAAQTLTLLKPMGVTVYSVFGELSSDAEIAAIIDAVKVRPGRVDILYNNAAIQIPWKKSGTSYGGLVDDVSINLFAIDSTVQPFAPGMKARGTGASST
jgi:NAD(P)-dependent dehydrogenase (short-subunit alcohol dehydrogenase family)